MLFVLRYRKKRSYSLSKNMAKIVNYLSYCHPLTLKIISFLLLSDKNKLKALHPFIHRCCSRFTYPGAWFSVSNYKHYKMCLF